MVFVYICTNTNNFKYMIKNLLSIVLITLFTTSTIAQDKIKGNKNVTTIETEVNSFNKIVVGEKFNISFMKDDVASVEIKTDENLHDVIRFSVTDSVLKFKTLKRITSRRALEITVRYTDVLKEIELKDNAELNSVNTVDIMGIVLKINDNARANLNLKNHSFKLVNNNDSKFSSKSRLNIESKLVDLELNESSNTEALITCDTLKLDMYQRANAKIEGDIIKMIVNTINSSNFTGKNLAVNQCKIIAEDSSDFSIQALDEITIDASGSSEISIYGNPTISIQKFSGTARLYKKEL